MILQILFQCLGGLGLFLFGMKIMSEGLQKVSGSRIRQILHVISNNRFIGCAVGAILTAIIQSSSATTVILVSFVDAGLLTLRQAIGVILGANIGTTVTAQLIAFKIQDYALPAIAAGIFLKFFSGGVKRTYVGDVLLGFGLVFFGLTTMKAGLAPLRTNPDFVSFFTNFNAGNLKGILLCVLTGTVLTMILQSSSATVGVTMLLASQGLLDFETSVALILGDNIGTTITAELASLGSNINARRTARAHTLFNIMGVLIVVLIFPYFIETVTWLTSNILGLGDPDFFYNGERPNISRYIANSHTIFNLLNALFFLVLLNYLARITVWITPLGDTDDVFSQDHHVKFFDSRYIETPSTALNQVKGEIIRMGKTVLSMYHNVVNSLTDRKVSEILKWRKREEGIDLIRREITRFLVRLAQYSITPEQSAEIRSLLRMANNLERIGDSVDFIAKCIQQLIEENLYLSEDGMKDYDEISHESQVLLDLVLTAMKIGDMDILEQAFRMERKINKMEELMKSAHLLRLQNGTCKVEPGLIFVNMLTAFRRMGGYCLNISQAIAGEK